MKPLNTRVFAAAAVCVAATTTGALAGGIDRSGQPVGIIFENTDYVQFSFGSISPSISSAGITGFVPATSDAASTYTQTTLAYNQVVNEQLSFGLIYDQPYGADIRYSDGPFAGGFASVDSDAVTLLARYKFGGGFSVHGGLRAQRLSGSIASIGLLSARSDWDMGWVAGVAYEKPEIAMRVALTYSSAITSGFSGTENFGPTSFDVELPESLNLDFQTGIAQNTLLFGQVRWVGWNGVNLTTPGVGSYVAFDEDTVSYSLGVGRRFNETWSGAITLGYEDGDGTGTVLGPTSGYTSIGLGVTYTEGPTKVTAGIRHVDIGDATAAGVPFSGNSATAVGIQIGYSF